MAEKSKNKNLTKAKTEKNDEFYTQLSDIEKELRHYKKHFKGKVVFCNCDDPEKSNFWQYFSLNFEELGLKKLIATHYETTKQSYKLEMWKDEAGIHSGIKTLEQNGDFRSPESITLLQEADIVVTNPPFSLFREYISQLMQYEKKFLIIGNKNAITYKEFFPLLKDNKVWIGYNAVKEFMQPDGTIKKFGNIGWYTNLDIDKRHENLTIWKKYTPEEYPKYDNYDAINVNKITDIPCDYEGTMGVPITFLDNYNPNQFEILGLTMAGCNEGSLNLKKDYKNYIGYKQNGEKTGRTGSTFGACPVLVKDDKKTVYYEYEGVRVQATYCRIFIKRKEINANENRIETNTN